MNLAVLQVLTLLVLLLSHPVEGRRDGWMHGDTGEDASPEATPSALPSASSLHQVVKKGGSWEVNTTSKVSSLVESPLQLASILCHPAPQPTIAYMFSGHPRTFAHPKVHLSFLQNVIHAFGAKPVFFFHFKTDKITYNDNYVTNSAMDGAQLSDGLRAELENVLQLFTPRVVVWAEDEDVRGEFNPNCDLYNSNGAPQLPLWRFLSQWKGLQHALHLVLDYEKKQGVSFDWVMKLRPDVLWYHGLKPYCGYNPMVAYNPSTFLGGPVPYSDWHMLVRGELAKDVFDTLGRYKACVGAFFSPIWEDAALEHLIQQGKLTDTNKNLGASFLPGYILRDCALKENEFCQYMGSPLYFANGDRECDTLLHTC